MGISDNAPNGYCGFMLEPEDVDVERETDDDWHETTRNACCLREPEYDEHCIWHSDIEKDASELAAARLNPADLEANGLAPADGDWEPIHLREHLSGLILRDVELPDGFSFEMCVLVGADVIGTDLVQARFSETYLLYSRFRYANLQNARFSGAHLYRAQFSEAFLRKAQFHGAHLREAQFLETNLLNARFEDANMRETQFHGGTLEEARFPKTNLYRARFSEAFLGGTRFPEASLRRAKFTYVNFRKAQFSKTDLSLAQFQEANLGKTEFQNADLRGVKLPSACTYLTQGEDGSPKDTFGGSLEDAQFEDRTDLRDADLSGARLYQTAFTDVRINDATMFGLTDGGHYGEKCRYDYDPNTGVSVSENVPRHQAAAWSYSRLESLFEDSAMDERARYAHIRKEEAQREFHWEQVWEADLRDERLKNFGQYLVSTLNWNLHRHGESLRQLLKVAAVTILTCGILYVLPWSGIARNNPETELRITSFGELLRPEAYFDLLNGLYFSVITFTTIGYGDFYPASPLSRLLVGIESLAGALLMALFVFVIGRRVAR